MVMGMAGMGLTSNTSMLQQSSIDYFTLFFQTREERRVQAMGQQRTEVGNLVLTDEEGIYQTTDMIDGFVRGGTI